MKKEKIIYKFNGGLGAVLCNNCHAIIWTGNNMPDELKKSENFYDLGPFFCDDKCKQEFYEKKDD